MKILITGATGFIGTNTAIELGKTNAFDIYGTYNEKKTP